MRSGIYVCFAPIPYRLITRPRTPSVAPVGPVRSQGPCSFRVQTARVPFPRPAPSLPGAKKEDGAQSMTSAGERRAPETEVQERGMRRVVVNVQVVRNVQVVSKADQRRSWRCSKF